MRQKVPTKITKDGRTIRTGEDYTEFRRAVHFHQDGNCKRCGRFTSLTADLLADHSFHVHHVGGRGLGGSKRNDILDKVEGLCGFDHRREHGQS
jgi:5-methylcytosine-specific restriction endonuclease McrA